MKDLEKLTNAKQAFIFDMDGTIVDLEQLNYTGYKETLQKFFDIDLDWENYLKYFAGTRTAEALNSFLQAHNESNYDVDQLIKNFRDIKGENLKNNFKQTVSLKPGILEYLNFLKSKSKQIALATSSVQKFTHLILKNFEIEKYFAPILTAADITNGKPDPEIYNKAIDLLKVEKQDALVFEDSKNGIESGLNADIEVVAIHTKGLNDSFVEEADYVIEDYRELIG